MKRFVSNDDKIGVLTFCHLEACGGHFSVRKIANKILQAGFIGPLFLKIVLNTTKLVLGANN